MFRSGLPGRALREGDLLLRKVPDVKLLEEGDVIELTSKHTVYAEVPKHFVYSNCRGDFSLTHTEARLWEGNFDYLRGQYVVVKTSFGGGGTGHGGHDVYPDGHRVFCEKTDGSKHRVDFYQTGCFTAMIPEIEVVGRAALKWSIEK